MSLYWAPPSPEEIAKTPWYTLKDYTDNEPVTEVWDENWDVLHLYQLYSTQWRMGMGGVTGLDFNVFHHALDRKGITGDEYDTWVSQLRVIEMTAMQQM